MVHPYPFSGFRERNYTLALQRIGGLELTNSSKKLKKSSHHHTSRYRHSRQSTCTSKRSAAKATPTISQAFDAIRDKVGNYQQEVRPKQHSPLVKHASQSRTILDKVHIHLHEALPKQQLSKTSQRKTSSRRGSPDLHLEELFTSTLDMNTVATRNPTLRDQLVQLVPVQIP